METQHVERRLAAIFAADVVGYSRLMEVDEGGTLARLKTHRLELIDPALTRCKGQLIKTTGDGLLVEFASVVDAVQCAYEIQVRMARRNADVAAERRIEYRIGINLGDVIVEEGDIFGDGVNIAARLEALAAPGGICVNRTVREQVADKLDIAFNDLGDMTVKNIARPVHVYAVKLPVGSTSGLSEATARPDNLAKPPAIVVLPFANMGSEPEQEFFADGITEDIITELSRFRELFVISRNSAFVFKGKAVNAHEISRALDVDYVVEGSVRRAGARVRVTVQLIDAEKDRHIWAERYDRQLEDIFDLQDEITRSIVATLPRRVEAARQGEVERKRPENMAAYECVLAGKLLHHRSTREANAKAQEMLDRAIKLDPQYAHAHAWKACVLGQGWVHDWCDDREAVWAEVGAELEVALTLDDNDSDVHRILAAVNLVGRDFDQMMYHQDRAISLNPNDDLIVVQQGEILTWLGRAEEGIEWIQKAMRLNPYHPERYWNHLGRAYFVARNYEQAANAFRHITKQDHTHHAFLAACYACLDDRTAAEAHVHEVMKQAPNFTIGSYVETLHYKYDEDRRHHSECLKQAGLPD